MTQIPQQENDIWVHEPKNISPIVDVSSESPTDVPPDEKYKWFQVVMPYAGETEKEKKEFQEAQMEQLRLGILKRQPPIPQIQQTTQMNFNGGSIGQPIQIGKPVEFDILPEEKKTVSSPSVSSKILDSLMGSQVINKKKLGPNDPCSCGSGKKFKKCHGRGQFN